MAAIALSVDARLIAVAKGYEFGEGGFQVVEVATGRLVSSGPPVSLPRPMPLLEPRVMRGRVFEVRDLMLGQPA